MLSFVFPVTLLTRYDSPLSERAMRACKTVLLCGCRRWLCSWCSTTSVKERRWWTATHAAARVLSLSLCCSLLPFVFMRFLAPTVLLSIWLCIFSLFLFVYIYTYIHIHIYAVVFNFGALFFILRVQKCSFFSVAWCHHLQTKKRVFPRRNLLIRTKLGLEKQTCGLSSNAFKNGALPPHNIGTPFSNASRHPIFERINFPCFRPRVLFPSQPRNPYFCSVFHVKQAFPEDPQKACICIISSQENITKKSKT